MFVEIAGGLAALALILLIGAMTAAMDGPKWATSLRSPGYGFLVALVLVIVVGGIFFAPL